MCDKCSRNQLFGLYLRYIWSRSWYTHQLYMWSCRTISTPYGDLVIEEFSVAKVREVDIVFLAVSGSFSEQYAPQIIAEDGPIVIDNSSAFRYSAGIPLVVQLMHSKSKLPVSEYTHCLTDSRDQRIRTSKRQAHCKPQLHHGNCSHCSLAFTPTLRHPNDDYVHISVCKRRWRKSTNHSMHDIIKWCIICTGNGWINGRDKGSDCRKYAHTQRVFSPIGV